MELHWEAVKACQRGASEASFLSRLHSQAAFNIHSSLFFFPPSDVSERYLGSLTLWRSDLATAKSVKYGRRGKRVQLPISQFGLNHALNVLDHHDDVSKDSFCVVSHLVLIFKKKVQYFLSFKNFPFFWHHFFKLNSSVVPFAKSMIPKISAENRKQPYFVLC